VLICPEVKNPPPAGPFQLLLLASPPLPLLTVLLAFDEVNDALAPLGFPPPLPAITSISLLVGAVSVSFTTKVPPPAAVPPPAWPTNIRIFSPELSSNCPAITAPRPPGPPPLAPNAVIL
jgi:hypothetical protein